MLAGSYSARPQRYAKKKWAKTKNDRSRKSVSSSTMILTGTITLLFVVTHLATFKFGTYYETPDGIRDLYRLQLAVFSNPGYVAFYVVAMGVIVFHLWHGVVERDAIVRHQQPDVDAAAEIDGPRSGRGPRPRLRDPSDLHLSCIGERSMILDPRIPSGPITDKWDRRKFENKLVNPANRRKYQIIVVGTGLAGASAAASLGELGYPVKAFFIHDSPRRAHSIAAQGGINAAKNYRNDGDSIYRLFYDTIKGGDYRAREANVYRLAQTSVNIIDQCVAQGVPFAREYGGLLDNRSFGGAQVSRTFYARGQTGQQLLLGAYQSLMRQVDAGTVKLFPRREMLDLVIVDGQARGIVVRNLVTGELESHEAHAVLLCTGGYGTVFYLSTNAINSNVTAAWRAHKRGAFFANPCFTQIHPTCIPVSGDHQSKLTLMSEACATTAASGCRSSRATSVRRRRFPRPTATITSSATIRASATWSRATSRHAPRRQSATKAAASAIRACRSISTSRTRSSASASRRSRRATATCSTCIAASPTRTRTRCRCASTPPSTTRWAGCGSTTT